MTRWSPGSSLASDDQHGGSSDPNGQTWDAMESYFECITTCSLDDGECVTQCVEQLRERS